MRVAELKRHRRFATKLLELLEASDEVQTVSLEIDDYTLQLIVQDVKGELHVVQIAPMETSLRF